MGLYDLTDSNGRAITKRMRYFDGQFLQDTDFIDEQKYQLERRLRLTRILHAPGVAQGLLLTLDFAQGLMEVSEGTAVDPQGRLVVVASPLRTSIAGRASGEELVLALSLTERSSDRAAAGAGTSGDTRFEEVPTLTWVSRTEWDKNRGSAVVPSAVALGRVILVQDTADAARVTFHASAPFLDLRERAGVVLPGGEGEPRPALRNSGGIAELAGRLSVTGVAAIGGVPRDDVGLSVTAQGGKILANGLYFSGATTHTDGLPKARLTQRWGMSYSSPSVQHPFTVERSLLVGYVASGEDWGSGNVLASGKIGIGTSTPTARLEISANASSTDGLLLRNLGGGGSRIAFCSAKNEQKYAITLQESNGSLNVQHLVGGKADALVLTQEGRIGLGTGSPQASLDVVGNARISTDLQVLGRLAAARLGPSLTADATQTLLMEAPSGNGHREAGVGNLTGLVLRGGAKVSAGDPLFQVRSEGNAARFFVEHDGYTGSKDNAAWFGGTSRTNIFLGDLAVGTTAAPRRLDLRGELRFNDSTTQRISGATVDGQSAVVVSGHFDELRIKGRVIDWTGGTLHLGYAGDSLSREVQLNGPMLRVKQSQVVEATLAVGTAQKATRALEVAGDVAVGLNVDTRPTNAGTFLGARLCLDGVYHADVPYWLARGLVVQGSGTSATYSSELRVNLGTTSKRGILRIGSDSGSAATWESALAILGDTSIQVGGGYPPFKLQYLERFWGSAITNIEYSLYEAMIVGFRTGDGDINEKDSGQIMKCYTEKDPNSNFWRVQADFRSHEAHESWDVWVMGIWKKWVAGAR